MFSSDNQVLSTTFFIDAEWVFDHTCDIIFLFQRSEGYHLFA